MRSGGGLQALAEATDVGAALRARRSIGVTPAAALHTHKRLFGALEALYPVSFRQDLDGTDGLLELRGDADRIARARSEGARPQLIVLSLPTPGAAAGPAEIAFGSRAPLARALRGRTLTEQDIRRATPAGGIPDDAVVLATREGAPTWACLDTQPSIQLSACPPAELAEGDTLRDHLRAGRFIALLPLLHLVWRVCEEILFEQPPLRASFVIDDPNLHWSSYGYIRYEALAEHAREHGYHVGLGMVPLDGWLSSARAVSVLADTSRLSLLVHGNDHTSRELGRLTHDAQAEAAIGQALRRTARFEHRTGLTVKRVMVPPHGACSQAAMRAMYRLGFDAACISRPYPWLDGQPAPSATAGWRPSELVGGGLPVLPRHPLTGSREDLVFRALLGQPLILYGHHWDLAGGLEALEQAAHDINSLGEVQWCSLDAIAARGYGCRRYGDTLLVETHTRRALIAVPPGVSSVALRVAETVEAPAWDRLASGSGRSSAFEHSDGWIAQPLAVCAGEQLVCELAAAAPLDPWRVNGPGFRPWPAARRLMVEARDRLQPRRAGRRAPAGGARRVRSAA